MNFAIAVIVLCVSIFMIALSFRAIFIAFVKKKDERSKWIVTKSMADSFIAIVIMQAIQCIIKWINYDPFQNWWRAFKEAVYIEPVFLSFMILGIILLINTKKHGGSL